MEKERGIIIAGKTVFANSDVEVVDVEQKANFLTSDIGSYVLHNPYPLIDIEASKKFICKGKHQYRYVKENKDVDGGTIIEVKWVCQCGRNMND